MGPRQSSPGPDVYETLDGLARARLCHLALGDIGATLVAHSLAQHSVLVVGPVVVAVLGHRLRLLAAAEGRRLGWIGRIVVARPQARPAEATAAVATGVVVVLVVPVTVLARLLVAPRAAAAAAAVGRAARPRIVVVVVVVTAERVALLVVARAILITRTILVILAPAHGCCFRRRRRRRRSVRMKQTININKVMDTKIESCRYGVNKFGENKKLTSRIWWKRRNDFSAGIQHC